MMNDFLDFIEAQTGMVVYPLSFPLTGEDEAAIVRVLPSYRNQKGGLASAEIQVIFRATHPGKAEALATDLLKKLNKKTGFSVGTINVVMTTIRNPLPLYIGMDENGRYKYSLDASLLIEN